MDQEAIVVGANGYLGRHLVRHLKRAGMRVRLFGRQERSVDGHADYTPLDLTNPKELAQVSFEADYVLHFAGRTGTLIGFAQYGEFLRANELGLLHLLDRIKECSRKPRLVFPSTRLVYKGQAEALLQEEDPPGFNTIYAINKFACERYIQLYHRHYQIPYTVFRICVPYGNELGGKYSYGTLGFFLGRALKKEPITLYGDGSLRRTFIHVADLCRIIIKAVQIPQTVNQIYNIGGEHRTLADVARMVARKYGVEVLCTEWPAEDLSIESGDTLLDDTKLRQVLSVHYDSDLQSWLTSF